MDTCLATASQSVSAHGERFGDGLTEIEMRSFQALLKTECGVDMPLPEACGRALELLSLVEELLGIEGALAILSE